MIFTNEAKQAMLTGIKERLNNGSGFATLKFYGVDNELLAIVDVDNASGVIEANVLTFKPVGNFVVTTSGTLTSAKLFADDDVLMIDELSVGTVASDILVDKVNVQLGGFITMSSFTIGF